MDYFHGFLVSKSNAAYLDDIIRGFYDHLNLSFSTNTNTLVELLSLIENRFLFCGVSCEDMFELELDFRPLAGIEDVELYPVFRFVYTAGGFILTKLFSEDFGENESLLRYNYVPEPLKDYVLFDIV